MRKICKKETCKNFVFGKGYCKNHQYLRKDKKGGTGEMVVFKEIWEERERYSFLSGVPLHSFEGTSFFPNLFAHVLPKKKYNNLRLEKENIVLLHPKEHYLYDFGTEQQRIDSKLDWSKLEEKKKILLEKFGI